MAPLTKLTGKGVPFQWGEVEQQAFDKAKVMISQDIMLAHPNFEKPFIIHIEKYCWIRAHPFNPYKIVNLMYIWCMQLA